MVDQDEAAKWAGEGGERSTPRQRGKLDLRGGRKAGVRLILQGAPRVRVRICGEEVLGLGLGLENFDLFSRVRARLMLRVRVERIRLG